MIKKAEKCHKDQIVKLWNIAFGDNINSVNKYLDTLLKYFFVYEDEGIVKAMLSVIPVSYLDKNGGYIYAVVTHPDYRGQGICKRLIDTIKEDKKYDFLVLVPQNEGLFKFYKRMNFVEVPLLVKKETKVKIEADTKLDLKKIDVHEYESLRNQYKDNMIKWGIEMLAFAKSMYGGEFYRIEHEENTGFAFLYREKKTLVIKELIVNNHEKIAEKIGSRLGTEKVVFSYPAKEGEPTYMIYPNTFQDAYFGIYLD